MIATIMAADLWFGYRSVERELRETLDQDARLVRAVLMATRRVYHQQFIASGLAVDEKTVGFLPAHALSRISAQFPEWAETGLRFNNVSDRPRNPANRADADELAAMVWFRDHPGAKERIVDVRDADGRSYYHFTAPIWIEPYCLQCHGDRDNAPASIRDRYADAYGYQLGDLRGVMSIKVPLDELRAKALRHWHQEFGMRVLGYIVLLVLLGLMMRSLVLRPVRLLKGAAERLGEGQRDVRIDAKGTDELAILGDTFNAMAGKLDAHAAQIDKLNRTYAALSETNQTIVRVNDEAELLRRTCRIAVDLGGVTMAWIGRRDPQTDRLQVAEAYGTGVSYVDHLDLDLRPEGAYGQGPLGLAWRSGEPQVVQDYVNDERVRPWRERASAAGWAAAAVFPIRRGDQVHMLLTLYHTTPHAFDAKVVDLLAEMASDLGYALDRIDLLAEQKRAHQALRDSEARYRDVLRTTRDGFLQTRPDGRIVDVNTAYIEMSGYSRDELLSMHVADLELSESPTDIGHHYRKIMERGGDVFETRHRTKSGGVLVVEVSVSRSGGGDELCSAFIRDLSTRDEARERIQRLSHFDTLTGLPNRALITDLAAQAIGQAGRNDEELAVVFIDIDNFKNVNDTLGHQLGDQLIVEMAQRLGSALRTEDTLSRLGGDEFILLLPHADAENAAHVAERLLAACAEPLRLDHKELIATATLGIAMFPSDGLDFPTLLRKADTATNRAKQEGRNTYRFFAPEMQQRSERTLQLEAALRHAIARDELILHYQPQIDIASQRVIGLEALIRWQHPELGLIPPAEFIPLAENSGLIVAIGEWVIAQALDQLKRLRHAGFAIEQVAVNLSAVQFRQPDLADRVERLIEASGLPMHALELELTESVTMEDPEAAIAVLDHLHGRGIRLSIDDFGTGYSSLSYLKRFHIDKLKIDQSFVRDLVLEPESQAIVRAVVGLAQSLHFRTIAEGVETADQLALLRNVGCQEIQGYLFSRPLPEDTLTAWLSQWPGHTTKELA